MDGANRLLGRGILRFDMRDPERFVLRLPHEGQVAPAKLDDMSAAVDELGGRSEEHTSELQSLMRISYAVVCLKKNKQKIYNKNTNTHIKPEHINATIT